MMEGNWTGTCVPIVTTERLMDSDDLNLNGLSNHRSFHYVGANEVRHVLGLRDKYQENVYGQPPMPGYEGRLMAYDGPGLTKADLATITTNPVKRLKNFLIE